MLNVNVNNEKYKVIIQGFFSCAIVEYEKIANQIKEGQRKGWEVDITYVNSNACLTFYTLKYRADPIK